MREWAIEHDRALRVLVFVGILWWSVESGFALARADWGRALFWLISDAAIIALTAWTEWQRSQRERRAASDTE